jgi:hypothetical protein
MSSQDIGFYFSVGFCIILFLIVLGISILFFSGEKRVATKIRTYNSIDEREDTKPKLKDYIPKTSVSLPKPFNQKNTETEAEILKAVCVKLAYNKIWFRRLNVSGTIRHGKSGSFMTPSTMKGMPDLLCLHNGTMTCLELKKPGGRVERHQLELMKELQLNGAKVFICTSSRDLDIAFTNKDPITYLEGIPCI